MTKKKKSQNQFAITCVFCGNPGSSKEHVFPKWLSNIISQTENSHTDQSLNTYFKNGRFIEEPFSKVRQGNLGSRKVKRVCAKCNNEWMSRLQNEAKPHLTKLIEGNNIDLTQDVQNVIAKWAVMTCIVGELTNAQKRGISANDSRLFYDSQQVPPFWKMWIGRYEGERTMRKRQTAQLMAPNMDELTTTLYNSTNVKPNALVSGIILGKLFLLIRSIPGAFYESIHMDDYPNKLKKLWPLDSDPIIWPPIETVSDYDFIKITDRGSGNPPGELD